MSPSPSPPPSIVKLERRTGTEQNTPVYTWMGASPGSRNDQERWRVHEAIRISGGCFFYLVLFLSFVFPFCPSFSLSHPFSHCVFPPLNLEPLQTPSCLYPHARRTQLTSASSYRHPPTPKSYAESPNELEYYLDPPAKPTTASPNNSISTVRPRAPSRFQEIPHHPRDERGG